MFILSLILLNSQTILYILSKKLKKCNKNTIFNDFFMIFSDFFTFFLTFFV